VPSSTRPCSRLIECSSRISIIDVLMGILLPALVGGACAAGAAHLVLSNQRQLAIGLDELRGGATSAGGDALVQCAVLVNQPETPSPVSTRVGNPGAKRRDTTYGGVARESTKPWIRPRLCAPEYIC